METLVFLIREQIQAYGGWLYDIPAMSPMAFGAAVVAGLIMGLMPSTLPLVPVVFGYVAGDGQDVDEARPRRKLRGLWLSFGFVLGTAMVDAAIGAAFGLLGYYVIGAIAAYRSLTNLFVGLVLAVMALALLRLIRIRVPVLRPALQRKDSFGGAFLLGIPFGLAVCPACTPLVLPILGAAAATQAPLIAAALLFVFGLGRGIPLLVAGGAAGAFKRLEGSARWVPVIERVGGVLLLVMALFFLYQSAVYGNLVSPL